MRTATRLLGHLALPVAWLLVSGPASAQIISDEPAPPPVRPAPPAAHPPPAPAPPAAAPPSAVAPPVVTPPTAVAPPAIPAAVGGPDTVFLKDGTTLSGTVLKQEVGKFVVIRTADGAEQTLDWASVARVALGAPPAAPTLVPPAPPPVAVAPTPTPVIPPAPPAEPIPPHVATEAPGGQPGPRFVLDVAVGGFLAYAPYAGYTTFGPGLEGSLSGIYGLSTFPDTHGGGWHGLVGQAFLQLWGAGVGDSVSTGGLISLNAGIGAGYTYVHLNEADASSHQRGLGFMATYRIGEEGFWFFGSKEITGSASSLAQGPWIAVLFPDYATQTRRLTYKYVDFNIVFADPGGGASIAQFELGGGLTF